MVAETFTLPAGVYHITAWVVDAWTDVNYTFAWTFTIYNATGSGGGGGPPLGGIPFGWVVALIIAAVAVGVLMGLGSRRRSNSWGWD